MKKILDLFKKKEKETDYEIVKSRSGLPMFVIPLPPGIETDFYLDKKTQQKEKTSNDYRNQQMGKTNIETYHQI